MNVWMAVLGVGLVVATYPLDAALSPAATTGGTPFVVEGRVLLTQGDLSSLPLAGPPESWSLLLNGGAAIPVTSASGGEDGRPLVLTFLEGAGSGDTAELLAGNARLPVRVATPPDAMPGPRYWGASAVADGIVYFFGGATWPEESSRYAAETFLDSILRIDLETGEVRTMAARLPTPTAHAAAAWDPTPSHECPAGCAYVFGGQMPDGRWLDSILRYDPSRDRLTPLAARIAEAGKLDGVALWTGQDILVVAGAEPSIHRFEPKSERVTTLGVSPFTQLWGTAGFFDERTSAACPRGCGYLVGGQDPFAFPIVMHPNTPYGPAHRGTIVRIDAESGAATPLDTTLPEARSGHAIAWDGERAWIVGGISCERSRCIAPQDVLAFDPATATVATAQARVPERPVYGSAHAFEGRAVVYAGLSSPDGAVTDPLQGFLPIDPTRPLERFVRFPLS